VVTFQIQGQGGEMSPASHKEFYKTLKDGSGHLCYDSGGTHIAMLPTETNKETIRVCRQADNAENYSFAANSRCLDVKGHLCRYQHDENGNVIRNKAGNPVSAKCGQCPRDGWIAGKRENCCIRNYCKTDDCAYCMKHREYRTPLSLERFAEDEYDGSEVDGAGYCVVDPQADIQTILESDELNSALYIAISQLSFVEQSVIAAIYWDKLSLRAYAAENGMSKSTAHRLHNDALKSLRKILKNYR